MELSPENTLPDPEQAAVKWCRRDIEWYKRNKAINRRWYQILQSIVLVMGGLSPILILQHDLGALEWLSS